MARSLRSFAALAFGALLLAGCTEPPPPEPTPIENASAGSGAANACVEAGLCE